MSCDSTPPDVAASPSLHSPTFHYPLEFHGSGSEYFRIWIVNTILTICTLGLYWPWAKVRNRRYFYENTILDGDAFAFLAQPGPLLRGYLIIGGAFIFYNLAAQFAPVAASLLLLGFILLWPWLFYKALRFRARYSAWRGVRWSFEGTLDRSYFVNLFMPILIPFTLGIIFPFIQKQKQEYLWSNLRLGEKDFSTRLDTGRFYAIYLTAGLLMGVGFVAIALVVSVVITAVGDAQPEILAGITMLAWIPGMLIFLFGSTYIYVATFQHTMNNFSLGEDIRFSTSLDTPRLAWIQCSNILLMGLTLGLFFPWAQVRRARYILSSITVSAPVGSLEGFIGSHSEEQSGVGDVASDIFDFEVGF